MLVPSGTVTRRSRGVMMAETGRSRRFSKRRSRLVTMPTTLPFSTTGRPDILRLRCARSSKSSRMRTLGAMITGSLTMPLSWRFTLETALACISGVMFLWMMPMPPSCAIEMAKRASVTVSIAAESKGRLSVMLRVSLVWSLTSRGSTVECAGTNKTSSKV